MSIPDWAEAPTGASHYDTYADCFCDINGWWRMGRYQVLKNQNEWGTSRYTPRPVEPWLPTVGAICQVIELPGAYIECEILANRHGDYIYYIPEKHGFGMLAAGAFRPARTQAQIERENLIRIATQVMNHDNVISERDAAEALYDAGMLKLPEGYRIER
jgi:hypothetical protein